ncbi:GDSL esterase/lipase [Acorus calamus]|uniref:GDSL esterase/lipase n=1 Tax=Acorus calamus TaxID=4465 RepID=A0AAV9D4E6_ACOCL|nr:GDSL esterase/lipase [Acorus calamus]
MGGGGIGLQTMVWGCGGADVPAVIVFGDSIVDPGNNNALVTLTKCNFPPYGRDFVDHRPTGRFSNGKIPTDLIASQLGVKEFIQAYLDPKLTIQDLLTGVSFASGGAGFDNLTAKIPSVYSLWDQLVMFEGYIEKVKAIAGENRAKDIVRDSLYILLSGSNDLLVTYFNTPLIKTHDDLPTYIDFLVQSASGFIRVIECIACSLATVMDTAFKGNGGCVEDESFLLHWALHRSSAPAKFDLIRVGQSPIEDISATILYGGEEDWCCGCPSTGLCTNAENTPRWDQQRLCDHIQPGIRGIQFSTLHWVAEAQYKPPRRTYRLH